jgi:pimeloyl-ACP methyl ester carboxylesterase
LPVSPQSGAGALNAAHAQSPKHHVAAATAADLQPARTSAKTAKKPTIVIVHGAFADASGFTTVIGNLQKKGYPVLAPANPLRGLASDSEYLRTFLSTIKGPIVLAAHSYGGAVITNAATGSPNVKALVYLAAFAPAEGESVAQSIALGGGHSMLLAHTVTRPMPGAGDQDADVTVDPVWFRRVFAQDLPLKQTQVMAAIQRPAAYSALATPSGKPAWASIPSWFLIAKADHVIPVQAQKAMAARAHGHKLLRNSSHVVMTSNPGITTGLIIRAANSTR